MKLRVTLMVLCAALAGGCAAVILNTPAASPERAVAALLLIGLLPGTALTALARGSQARGPGATAALSIALSLSATILASIGLYFAGVRLDLDSWTVALTAITVVAALAAAVRGAPVALPGIGLSARPSLPLAVGGAAAAVLLGGAAVLTARSVSDRVKHTAYTQLWALPSAGNARAARIGIYNHQGGARRYELRVYDNGTLVRSQMVALADRRSFTTTEAPRDTRGSNLRVTIALPDRLQGVYRWVQVHVGGGATA